MEHIDLTPIFQAIILLIAALITTRLIPWIKSKTTQSQYDLIESMLYGLVAAAENLYKQGRIKDKLGWVQERMYAKGYDVDTSVIEGVVANLFPHEEPPD